MTMIKFTLKQDQDSKLYSVYENGKKAKNAIYSGIKDFENELKSLDFQPEYTISIINQEAITMKKKKNAYYRRLDVLELAELTRIKLLRKGTR